MRGSALAAGAATAPGRIGPLAGARGQLPAMTRATPIAPSTKSRTTIGRSWCQRRSTTSRHEPIPLSSSGALHTCRTAFARRLSPPPAFLRPPGGCQRRRPLDHAHRPGPHAHHLPHRVEGGGTNAARSVSGHGQAHRDQVARLVDRCLDHAGQTLQHDGHVGVLLALEGGPDGRGALRSESADGGPAHPGEQGPSRAHHGAQEHQADYQARVAADAAFRQDPVEDIADQRERDERLDPPENGRRHGATPPDDATTTVTTRKNMRPTAAATLTRSPRPFAIAVRVRVTPSTPSGSAPAAARRNMSSITSTFRTGNRTVMIRATPIVIPRAPRSRPEDRRTTSMASANILPTTGKKALARNLPVLSANPSAIRPATFSMAHTARNRDRRPP